MLKQAAKTKIRWLLDCTTVVKSLYLVELMEPEWSEICGVSGIYKTSSRNFFWLVTKIYFPFSIIEISAENTSLGEVLWFAVCSDFLWLTHPLHASHLSDASEHSRFSGASVIHVACAHQWDTFATNSNFSCGFVIWD